MLNLGISLTKKSSINTLDPSAILYEDNHLLVVNKAPGQLVQGDKTGDVPLVDLAKAYIKTKYNKPGEVFLGVVHRLDRPTSGVLVFARTSKALSRLNEQFKSREAKKIYWAIVEGTKVPKQQSLKHWLVRNPKQNKSYAHKKEIANSKEARLSFQLHHSLDRYSCLAIELDTGRHHQIRAQLSFEGHIIKGDLKYGAARSNKDGSICLHARSLEILHPVKKEAIKWTAAPPKDVLWSACVAADSSRTSP